MFDLYEPHNRFRRSVEDFKNTDPHLFPLRKLPLVHPLDWWREIDWTAPGIYVLTGGRQIGKSTSLKLLIAEKLKERAFTADRIFYLPCDQILDFRELARTIELFLAGGDRGDAPFLLLIDEVTFVREWERAIKALADEGRFRRGFCVLTGSDTVVLQDAARSFPGRRGEAAQTDFHLLPLSFREYAALVEPGTVSDPESHITALWRLFSQYLQCGGYLRAINDLAKHGEVKTATFRTFQQWIEGDFQKRGKQRSYLLALLKSLAETNVSQMTYSRLAERTGAMSKETLIDYCRLLERMDIICILQAFDQNSRRGFPRKAMKFHFADPFVSHTVVDLLYQERMIAASLITEAQRVEATVAAHDRRRSPTYYIKAAGEIDVVVVTRVSFVPIEVKWSGQIRQRDLKQLKKYSGALIVGQGASTGEIDTIPVYPLPLFLVKYPSEAALEARRRGGG
jgi:hypothetical protein